MGLTLRPEAIATSPPPRQARRRAENKEARTSARTPDAQVFDVPSERVAVDTDGLTDEVRQQLISYVSIPRPVFIADLPAVAPAEIVAAWETDERGRDDSSVRFVTPKPRHRLRGSLVLPYETRSATTEFTRSIWGECLVKQQYRGTQLYELAVLIHQLDDTIFGFRLTAETALLRLNQPRGLVGVSVVLDGKLGAGEPARLQLIANLKELMAERLTLITVLVINADALQPVIDLLSEEAARNRWEPTMPIVAARSWEYADNAACATLVLGS